MIVFFLATLFFDKLVSVEWFIIYGKGLPERESN